MFNNIFLSNIKALISVNLIKLELSIIKNNNLFNNLLCNV